MKTNKNQSGFSAVELLIILVLVALIGAAGFFVMSKNRDKVGEVNSSNAEQSAGKSEVKIKHLGVDLDYYDPKTNKAGDFEFTKTKFDGGRTMQSIFWEYGMIADGNSANGGQRKANPQPTFIVPLGTKVHAIIDGVVEDVPKLYSNDYSVMVRGEGSDLIFEMEHVMNVTVKKGDTVKAGDVIAEVSDYSKEGFGGFGLVEIGVLQGGNPPKHLCTFDYLDESIKEETAKKITAFKKAWEEYRGDNKIYDESKEIIPGCLTRDPIEG